MASRSSGKSPGLSVSPEPRRSWREFSQQNRPSQPERPPAAITTHVATSCGVERTASRLQVCCFQSRPFAYSSDAICLYRSTLSQAGGE